ncbi:hypothetical protein BJV82DRAFT_620316 [Fennellomyces sp. T-0311]|nr:hypothetical protein BJV82DRAFT_620316 [Fennellomyces sp. T-0311]
MAPVNNVDKEKKSVRRTHTRLIDHSKKKCASSLSKIKLLSDRLSVVLSKGVQNIIRRHRERIDT